MAHRSTPSPNVLGWVVLAAAIGGMLYVFTRKKAVAQPLGNYTIDIQTGPHNTPGYPPPVYN